jgi:hypothetical protein
MLYLHTPVNLSAPVSYARKYHLNNPPIDSIQNTATKALNLAEIEASGASLIDLRPLTLERLQISKDHDLLWAIQLLETYGPVLDANFAHFWFTQQLVHKTPRIIRSEQDTAMYFTTSLLEPSLTAAIFLHAQHLQLTQEDAQGFPSGNWEIVDFSTHGATGQADRGIVCLGQNPKQEHDQLKYWPCNSVFVLRVLSLGDHGDLESFHAWIFIGNRYKYCIQTSLNPYLY